MALEALSKTSDERLDYGHPLEFGYFLTPDAGDPVGVLETARLLDALGYDLIGVQDHPYQRRFLDTSSLLAAILAQAGACGSSPTWETSRSARRPCSPRPRRRWIC